MEENKILFRLLKDNKYNEFTDFVLKNNEIDLNFKDETGNYLITYAIIKNNVKLVDLLLKHECKIDINDQEGKTLLYLPIKYGYDDIIKLIIEYDKHNIGISIVDFKDKFNNIPLHYAIFFKNIIAIDILLDANSNPNTNDDKGNNSLHLAIYTKDIRICKKIIDKDININAKTSIGETALHLACNFGLSTIAKLLVENNVDINAQDYDNEITALVYSINLNDTETSKYLLFNGANPNIQDFMGNTSTHYIIIEENYELLHELFNSPKIKIKPNVSIYNINGKLPLHLLLEKDTILENEMITELIMQSNLNYQDNTGNTPLHLICKQKIWSIYKKILIKKKLNVFIKNKDKKMPINYIPKNEINDFINLVTDSYLYILRHYTNVWKEDWEILCNKELFLDKLNPEELKIISKYVKKSADNSSDVCQQIVNKKILDIYNSNDANCTNTSYPIKKDSVKCILGDQSSKTDLCTFTGSSIDILIGLIYLLSKHDYACSTITSNFMINTDLCNYFSDIGIKTKTRCNFLNFEIVWIYKKLFFSDNFIDNFHKCSKNVKTRFIIVPLGIELSNGSHANYLIFDKKTYEIERFEPYGSDSPYRFNYNSNLLDTILSFKFREIDENIKYIKPKSYLPKIGFQYFDVYESNTTNIGDPGGFCALWSIWYTDMRLKYPEVGRAELVNKLLKEIKMSNASFKSLIRNYSINITNIRDDVFKVANITINDWQNDQYTDEQFGKITNEITILLNKYLK